MPLRVVAVPEAAGQAVGAAADRARVPERRGQAAAGVGRELRAVALLVARAVRPAVVARRVDHDGVLGLGRAPGGAVGALVGTDPRRGDLVGLRRRRRSSTGCGRPWRRSQASPCRSSTAVLLGANRFGPFGASAPGIVYVVPMPGVRRPRVGDRLDPQQLALERVRVARGLARIRVADVAAGGQRARSGCDARRPRRQRAVCRPGPTCRRRSRCRRRRPGRCPGTGSCTADARWCSRRCCSSGRCRCCRRWRSTGCPASRSPSSRRGGSS